MLVGVKASMAQPLKKYVDFLAAPIFVRKKIPALPRISTEVECSFSRLSLVVSPPISTTSVELSFSRGQTSYTPINQL